ncbi:hypothetical protein J6X09_00835, partial [Candidatus Saccharibacteria bacterium]|nr:hypothetical protein [Candidatus Saccharibacteria bacterium]
YLYNAGRKSWSISPWTYDHKTGMNFVTDGYIRPHGVYDQHGLRPVVTLRAGMKFNTGDGLKTNPYIVE